MKRLAALAIAVSLVGCSDDDWGDKISNFVDNEVYGLTRSIAENELNVRWFDYFQGLSAKGAVTIHASTLLLDTTPIASAPLDTFEQRENALSIIAVADENNVEASRMLQSAIAEMDGAAGICENPALLYQVDVLSLGDKIASQITLPPSEWYVEVSCTFGDSQNDGANNGDKKSSNGEGCWKSLVSVVTAIFGADKQRQQEEKARAAIARIPSKVVSASEVEALSKNICIAARSQPQVAAAAVQSRSRLVDASKAAREIAASLRSMRIDLEQYQAPALLQKARDSSGVERVAQKIAAEYTVQRIDATIGVQRKELAAFEQRFRVAASCASLLASWDQLKKALAEKRDQLSAVLTSADPSATRFSALLQQVKLAEAALPTEFANRKAKLCGA